MGIFVAGLVAGLLVFASAPISRSTLIMDLCLSPQVITERASEITHDSATLNGEVLSLGEVSYVAVSLEWGTNIQYGSQTSLQVMTSPGTFSLQVSGLNPATEYHYRAVATNLNSAYGKDKTFTTTNL